MASATGSYLRPEMNAGPGISSTGALSGVDSEAGPDIAGTTSADDEMLTLDTPEFDDEDQFGSLGLWNAMPLPFPELRPWHTFKRSPVTSVVIEEDEEGMSSAWDDEVGQFKLEVGRCEIRQRLWAQSLLCLQRSIDEIHSLCEYESDQVLCEEVRRILDTASNDFTNLIKQLAEQEEHPFKSSVAWTTRTPRTSKRGGESLIEQLERERSNLGSPNSCKSFSGSLGGSGPLTNMLQPPGLAQAPATPASTPSGSAAATAPAVRSSPTAASGAAAGPMFISGIVSASPMTGLDPPPGLASAGLASYPAIVPVTANPASAPAVGIGGIPMVVSQYAPEVGLAAGSPVGNNPLIAPTVGIRGIPMSVPDSALQDGPIAGSAEMSPTPSVGITAAALAAAPAAPIEAAEVAATPPSPTPTPPPGGPIRVPTVVPPPGLGLPDPDLVPEVTRPSLTEQGGGTGEAAGGNTLDEPEEPATAVNTNNSSQREGSCQMFIAGADDPADGGKGRSENLADMVQSALRRVERFHLSIQQKLSPEEILKRCEDRQANAQQIRDQHNEKKVAQGKETEKRMEAARERREEKDSGRQDDLLNKMGRARQHYQEGLRRIWGKAHDHNVKTKQVFFLAKENAKGEPTVFWAKQIHAESCRSALEEIRKAKMIENNERIARATDNRKKLEEEQKLKVQEALDAKERAAAKRREEHITAIKVKGNRVDRRSELVRAKRQQMQEMAEQSTQEFVDFRNKTIGRMALSVEGLPDNVRAEVEQLQAAAPTQTRRTATHPGGPRPKGANRKPTPLSPDIDPQSEPSTASKNAKKNRRSAAAARREDSEEIEAMAAAVESAGRICETSPNPSPAKEVDTSVCRGRSMSSFGNSETDQISEAEANQAAPDELGFHVQRLRQQLQAMAITDQEACRLTCDAIVAKGPTPNRSRLSKLASDLKKAVAPGLTDPDRCIDYNRVDTILGDFIKVLGQSQREEDFGLVVKLGCAGLITDLCVKIKESLPTFAESKENQATQAWRVMSNVLLGSLKWLGLVCKHDFARIYMALTNRTALLADVTMACLKASSLSVLFLPQSLNVLSMHLKISGPATGKGSIVKYTQIFATYLLLCGLPAQIRALFRRAEAKCRSLFEEASPMPLMLFRAMSLVSSVLAVHASGMSGTSASADVGGSPADEDLAFEQDTKKFLLKMFQDTELMGIVSILVSILLCEGGRQQKQKGKPTREPAPKLPEAMISLSFQGVRILNAIARLDLPALQDSLGPTGRHEVYHMFVRLLDYCGSRQQGGLMKPDKMNEETQLLHETLILLGFYCLENPENQKIMTYGGGQTLLVKVTALPLHYFMITSGQCILFPTILAACFRSERNLDILRKEMNMGLLQDLLGTNEGGEDGFGGRFPKHLWEEAIAFFCARGERR